MWVSQVKESLRVRNAIREIPLAIQDRSFNEDGFALTVQKGKKESIYIGIVGGRSLLTINFDDTTTQGAVQLYAAETTKKLE